MAIFSTGTSLCIHKFPLLLFFVVFHNSINSVQFDNNYLQHLSNYIYIRNDTFLPRALYFSDID